jgi:hypothetical protein
MMIAVQRQISEASPQLDDCGREDTLKKGTGKSKTI